MSIRKIDIAKIVEKAAWAFALIGSGILALFAAAMFFYGMRGQHKADLVAIGLAVSLLFVFSVITWLIWNIGKFKIVLRIIVVLIAVPVSFWGYLVGAYIGYGEYQDLAMPEICKNLTSSVPAMGPSEPYMSAAFDERIQKMYAAPISEDDLKRSLVKQGFYLPDHPNPASLPHVWTYFDYHVFPCDQGWVVEWTTQDDGIAHDIHGRYSASCL